MVSIRTLLKITNNGDGYNLDSGEGDFEDDEELPDGDGIGASEYEEITDEDGLFCLLFLRLPFSYIMNEKANQVRQLQRT